ncbi:probable cyclin-dependent serine/threonine-protein kinase DDB_G0292550 [Galleria mellonella]|uniref:Probable cyclin-dependent serine/threonine-protein kinase DDB_G0292550 n=1 Tax=Galleria mellonella TaxID=7137 RepID=A0A6J3CEY0_GALME|nr:probable cyclin-dependent serine/threonine-protein kinase DDB_G0292550 [Galleria mellonella]
MIALFIVLFSCVVLVIGNPLTQLLPLLSSQNYNQNNFRQPPSVPYPPQISSYNTPYSQQPASNNNLYLQQLLNQNQIPANKCPCNQLQQNTVTASPKENVINQLYLNKLTTNPVMQRILGANGKYIPNGIEIPTQPTNVPNTGVAPNIVNNYYILSPEYLDAIEQDINEHFKPSRHFQREEHVNYNGKMHRPPHSSSRQSESVRPRKKSNTRIHENSEKNHDHNSRSRNRDINHRGETGKRKAGKNDKTKHVGSKKNATERNRPSKTRNMDNNENIRNSSKDNEQQDFLGNEPSASPDVNESPDIISKPDNLPSNMNDEKDQLSVEKTTVSSYEGDKPKNNKKNNKIDNNSRKSRDDIVIRDIHRKFPGIPEEVIRKLLTYLRRQCTNQQLGKSRSSKNAQSLKTESRKSHGGEIRNKSGNSNRRKRKKQKENTKTTFSYNDEIFDTSYTTTDINLSPSSTTDKIIDYDETTDQKLTKNVTEVSSTIESVDLLTTTQDPNIYDIMKTVPIETTTETYNLDTKIPKLGEEDAIDEVENFVVDYYPNFTMDNTNTESDDDYIRNHRDNRHFYGSDRNDRKRINREKLQGANELFNDVKVTNNNNYYHKHYDQKYNSESTTNTIENEEKTSTEMNNDLNDATVTEYIVFQTPPVLENPNFQTRQVDIKSINNDYKNYYHHEFPRDSHEIINIYLGNSNDKLSSYSDTKAMQFIDSKHNKVTPKEDINVDIETVFAKSKVVKYGHNQDPLKEVTTTEKINIIQNNKPVLVFAKSMTSEDPW